MGRGSECVGRTLICLIWRVIKRCGWREVGRDSIWGKHMTLHCRLLSMEEINVFKSSDVFNLMLSTQNASLHNLMEKLSIESFLINLSPWPETCFVVLCTAATSHNRIAARPDPGAVRVSKVSWSTYDSRAAPGEERTHTRAGDVIFRQWLMPYTGECIPLGIDFQTHAVCN